MLTDQKSGEKGNLGRNTSGLADVYKSDEFKQFQSALKEARDPSSVKQKVEGVQKTSSEIGEILQKKKK